MKSRKFIIVLILLISQIINIQSYASGSSSSSNDRHQNHNNKFLTDFGDDVVSQETVWKATRKNETKWNTQWSPRSGGRRVCFLRRAFRLINIINCDRDIVRIEKLCCDLRSFLRFCLSLFSLPFMSQNVYDYLRSWHNIANIICYQFAESTGVVNETGRERDLDILTYS